MNFIKRLIQGSLIGALLTTTAIVSANELEGTWRGEMEIQEGVKLVIGVRVEEGQVFLESPNQGMFGKEPTTFDMTDNQITFTDSDLNAEFTGTLEDGVLQGVFVQGRTYNFPLHRLDNEDLARVEQYEGQYAGDLVINGRATLPLVVNIAVLDEGYLATLDSPEQQSYGIPVSDLEITEETLSFSSPLIQATYEGEFNGELYEGSFFQGQARVLNLKKSQRGEPLAANTNTFEVGTLGGAVAVVSAEGVETTFYGEHDANTVFEIGSVTKTMVAYLFAQAIADERVDETTTIERFWPESGKEVTLLSLATHHSGLPRLPADLLSTADPNDPYAHYDATYLSNALTTAEVGSPDYEYSNFGYGVLAEAVSMAYEQSFSSLMEETLFSAAEMDSSYVAITGTEVASHAAKGHALTEDEVPYWHFTSLAGAGAVVSSLSDMVNYVSFIQNKYVEHDPVIRNLLSPRESLGEDTQQALGWIISKDESDNAFAWHNGQTAGFSSFVGFYLDGSKAVVVLNNQSISLNEEAMEILTGD